MNAEIKKQLEQSDVEIELGSDIATRTDEAEVVRRVMENNEATEAGQVKPRDAFSVSGGSPPASAALTIDAEFQGSTMNASADVPQQLKDIPNWIVWKREKRNGKSTKIPYDAKKYGVFAKPNDPSTWASYEQALEEATSVRNFYDGLGFMLLGTDLAGVDFDGVLHDGIAESFVGDILEKLGNPYCEITPSGNGLRAFVHCAKLPEGKRKISSDKYGAEIYSGGEAGRYLTVTGNRFSGSGIPTVEDISIPYFMITQVRNQKLKKLWMGNTSEYGNDQSRTDFALLAILAPLVNKDAAQLEKLFSASKLGQRDKWVNREDYRKRSIAAILETRTRHEHAPEKGSNSQPKDKKELEFHLPAVITGTHRDYVIAPAPGQEDGWFPLGEPSIIGGPSGGNKTTLMLQMLLTQAIKAPFFCHETYGRPYLVLTFDRGANAQKRTMRRMHLETASIPIKSLPLAWGIAAAQEIVNKIEETNPLPEIVFIEGCDMLVRDPSKMEVVAPFMRELQRIADYYHIAIIGSVGAAKCKAGQGYIAKRDNLFGSVVWSRTCETVMLLQFPGGKDTSSQRELTVLLRNAPPEEFTLVLKDGLLEVQTQSDKPQKQEPKEIHWFKEQVRLAKEDPTKMWWTVLDAERALKSPHSTVDRWIKDAYAKKYLLKKTGGRNGRGRGAAAQYRWNESGTNPLWIEQQDQEQAEMTL